MNKKTKIVCTIGPASWDPKVIRKMIAAGMNCARVNGAFADTSEIDKVTKLIRDESDEVALMMDVKGPEVRMNKFKNPLEIKSGDLLVIGNTQVDEIYPANYKDLYKVLKVGQRIVIGDGDVELKLEKKVKDKMYCRVVFGEVLKPGKALNLPGATYTTNVLTAKDIENLKHSIKMEWDFVSASFVQNAKAAREIRKYLKGSNMKLIAKIEDQQGLDNIDEILSEVDGVMIARGGLGVELGLEKVPMVERMLIQKCNEQGKPVITATQMLESMIQNPKPTRAEVNDVATAIFLGTDAVMLSAESSAGKYPVEAVAELSKISFESEQYLSPQKFDTPVLQEDLAISAICDATYEAIYSSDINKLMIITDHGQTARFISRYNLDIPVITYVQDKATKRHLAITKGIDPILLNIPSKRRDDAIDFVIKNSLEKKLLKKKDKVLIIGSLSRVNNKYSNLFEIVEVN